MTRSSQPTNSPKPPSAPDQNTPQTSSWLAWRLYLGTLAGFPLLLHWSLLIWFPLILLNLLTVQTLTILLLSILLHELAHAIVCRALKLGSGSLTLWWLGGYFLPLHLERIPSHMQSGERLRYIAMVAAGPLTNAALGAGVILLTPWKSSELLEQIAMLNLGLAAFNLLPFPPLDGEKIVVGLGLFLWQRRRIYQGLTIILMVAGISGFSAVVLWPEMFSPLVAGWMPYALTGAVHAARLSTRSDDELAQEYLQAIHKEREHVRRHT